MFLYYARYLTFISFIGSIGREGTRQGVKLLTSKVGSEVHWKLKLLTMLVVVILQLTARVFVLR